MLDHDDAQTLIRIPAIPVDNLNVAKAGKRPDLRWLPIDALVINAAYQRQMSHHITGLARKMIENFRWHRVKPISVVELDDGRFEVFDGRLTAIVLRSIGGIKEVPAIVCEAQGAQALAADFVDMNKDRASVTPHQRFLSDMSANVPDAVAADDAIKATGARLVNSAAGHKTYKVGEVVCIGYLRKIAMAKGRAGVRRVLRIGMNACLAPMREFHLKAMFMLIWGQPSMGEITDKQIETVLLGDPDDLHAAARAAHRGTEATYYQTLATKIFERAK